LFIIKYLLIAFFSGMVIAFLLVEQTITLMKKIIPIILIAMLLPVVVTASDIKARISSGNKHKIRVYIDGHMVNRSPHYEVSLNHLRPGKHFARVEIYGHHGKRVIHDQIYLKKGSER